MLGWEIVDVHRTLASLPRFHSQGPALRLTLDNGQVIPVDYNPYILVTGYIPGVGGNRNPITVTPAGQGYLFFTKGERTNTLFYPDIDPEFLAYDDKLPSRTAQIFDDEDEETESADDDDSEGDDDDAELSGPEDEDDEVSGPVAAPYEASNPFGFTPASRYHVSAVDPEQFVPFSTIMRTTLPTIYGLNGQARFSCWARSARHVVPYTPETEKSVFTAVASLQALTERGTRYSVDLPPNLYFMFGDTGSGKSTMMTTVLPQLFSPKLRWAADPLIKDPRKLVGYVGFGEPTVFARDGSDWPGLMLDMSAALTQFPIVFVDSMKVVQVSGDGAAMSGGFMRWAYAIFQSWARMAQLNGLIIVITLHSYGAEEELRAKILNELAAISGGYIDLKEFKKTTGYECSSTIRVPVSIGTRSNRTYFVPVNQENIATILRGIDETFKARKQRADTFSSTGKLPTDE
jgi:hypothetical protein